MLCNLSPPLQATSSISPNALFLWMICPSVGKRLNYQGGSSTIINVALTKMPNTSKKTTHEPVVQKVFLNIPPKKQTIWTALEGGDINIAD